MAKYTNLTALEAAAKFVAENSADAELTEKLAKMVIAAKKTASNKTDYANTSAGKLSMQRAKAIEQYILNVNRPVTSAELGEKLKGFVNVDGKSSYRAIASAAAKAIRDFGTIERGKKLKWGGQPFQSYQPAGYVETEQEEE